MFFKDDETKEMKIPYEANSSQVQHLLPSEIAACE
jgi:hypothetical protein